MKDYTKLRSLLVKFSPFLKKWIDAPSHDELTTQEAADLINVSLPFLIKQLEEGIIPYHKVGKHHRVRFTDLMEYKTNIDAARNKVLDELVEESEKLGLYDSNSKFKK